LYRGRKIRIAFKKLIAIAKKRVNIANETIATETVFANSLEVLVTKFLDPLKTAVDQKKLKIPPSFIDLNYSLSFIPNNRMGALYW
jgi:hypothetical protein